MPHTAVLYLTREERERSKKKPCCPKSCRPYMVLHIVLLAYVVIGALIFHSLERDQGSGMAANLTAIRQQVTADLRKNRHMNTLNWNVLVENNLQKYEKQMRLFYENGAKTSPGHTWNYQSAMYFCLTVLSTIGYGNIVPATEGGKLFCVPYALIGIPLFFLYLAKLGELLASPLKKIYKKIVIGDKRRVCSSKHTSSVHRTGSASSSAPKGREQRVCNKDNDTPTRNDGPCSVGCSAEPRSSSLKQGQHTKESGSETEIQVPIYLLAILLIAYILLSALVFASTQDGWSYLDAMYFCTITYTTVGFGDMLPKVEDGPTEIYLEVFILCGLILMSTCVHLTITRMKNLSHFLFGNGNDHASVSEFEDVESNSPHCEEQSILYVNKSTAMTRDNVLDAAAV
ncbi:TWiK family of potassium channels protein 7-like [Saccoglossus kowalevskii]|uniref:TWiK family of potassium channels protein 7-like n=1 Tax=Saccoglossus kowalevskii TaxID=10224 RepID=A0ABM0LUL8_SACKO|nr:PREDICTED: TWiK family of potassium channels protein 7-like [Saccoglossus kowalevskii]